MIEALNGKLTSHHQFMLKTIKRSMLDKEALIEELDTQIEVATKAYQVDIENLQTIPGVGKDSVIGIISKIGGDMSRFPNHKHLSSWSGMSPGNNESGGKKVARTVHGNKYLHTTLVEAAWGATRKKDCFLKRKYESLAGRRGKKKALVVVGHKITLTGLINQV